MYGREKAMSASDIIGGADESERICLVIRNKRNLRQTLSCLASDTYWIRVPAHPEEIETLPVRGGPLEFVVAYVHLKNQRKASVPV